MKRVEPGRPAGDPVAHRPALMPAEPELSPEPAERTAELLRVQQQACRAMGSELYADLLGHLAADLLAGGPTADVLAGHLTDRGSSAVALRLLGGVHALVLSRQAPALALYYPSVGGTASPGPGAAAAWAAMRQVLAQQRAAILPWLDRPPQTNEPGRGAVLIGGLRHIAAAAALPIRLTEIGASAGLNLRADMFCVLPAAPASPPAIRAAGRDLVPGREPAADYGDPSAPVVLRGAWRGALPPPADIRVIARTGGDTHPVDPATPAGRLRLTAYVWPDQRDRLERLRGALALAARVPVQVRREPASATLARTRLAEGSWTVLWHSVFRQYIAPPERAALTRRVAELAAAATPTARFGYLFFEPTRERGFVVTLATWPGGRERILGVAAPHGIPVTWAPGGAG
ncbi:MAG: DUF2332 domain-containing protein [Streptosporangiaceae bacterium]